MIQNLLDKEAIRDCLYRYCRGIDRADEAILRSAYWPDAHDRHGAYVGDVEGFFAQALPRLRCGGRGVQLSGAANQRRDACARDFPMRPLS